MNVPASILPLILFLGLAIPVRAAVVINELYPKTSDVSWSWVELYNTGSETISLNQWRLDHTTGDGKSYILNASANISPHGFLTLYGTQTAIVYNVQGDTVRLFDPGNTQVDSQSYWGTLGYNTAMGRSTDGGDGWVICTPDPYIATPNTNNKCPPAPTPTPTPFPTPTPQAAQPTPTPTTAPATKSLIVTTPTPAGQSFGSLLTTAAGPRVLGTTDSLSPIPIPVSDEVLVKISKPTIAYFLLGVAAAALAVMLYLRLRRRNIRQ